MMINCGSDGDGVMDLFIPSPLVGEGYGGGCSLSRATAITLRKNPTETESVLWRDLRLRQFKGFKFRR